MTRIVLDFWSNVKIGTAEECWIWQRSCTPFGHGHFSIKHKNVYAHRHAYELTYGDIPSGMYVCHSCDTPACCNPFHLWIGTANDNAQDRDKKGRQNTVKVTSSMANEIRDQRRQGKLIREIAENFSLHRQTITRVLRGYRRSGHEY